MCSEGDGKLREILKVGKRANGGGRGRAGGWNHVGEGQELRGTNPYSRRSRGKALGNHADLC